MITLAADEAKLSTEQWWCRHDLLEGEALLALALHKLPLERKWDENFGKCLMLTMDLASHFVFFHREHCQCCPLPHFEIVKGQLGAAGEGEWKAGLQWDRPKSHHLFY